MKKCNVAFLLAFLTLSLQSASATASSFTGHFSQDDDVQFFSFSVDAPGNVAFQTLSFAGGVNAAGNTIAAGGFVPFLHLWDAFGNDMSGVESVSGDLSWNINLTSVGSYILALSENNNKAIGDLPGAAITPAVFDHYGQGNFTAAQFSYTPAVPGSFIAPDGSQRSNLWALDILGVKNAQLVGTSAVPVPGAMGLMTLGIAVFGLFGRRRNIA